MKRQRGRARRPNYGHRSFESNGPDIKIRGTANQIHEKYLQYARDAHSSGDRVRSENFFQHAEHYYRLMALNGSRERQTEEIENTPPGSEEQPPETRSHPAPPAEDRRRRSGQNRRPRPDRPDRMSQPADPSINHGGGRSALDTLAQEQATVSEN